jgi:hypothetical protein
METVFGVDLATKNQLGQEALAKFIKFMMKKIKNNTV